MKKVQVVEMTWDQFKTAHPQAAQALDTWLRTWVKGEEPLPENITPIEKFKFYDRGQEGGISAEDPDTTAYEFIYFPTRNEWEPENR